MHPDFEKKLTVFFNQLGQSAKMVLATSLNNIVGARTVSVIIHDGRLYFQTDKTLRKYDQLIGNKNVALCVDNIQIEGTCSEMGHPADNPDFCERYKTAFSSSFAAYTNLKNERLFEVTPVFIQQWIYIDGAPYVEQFDLPQKTYKKEAYEGK